MRPLIALCLAAPLLLGCAHQPVEVAYTGTTVVPTTTTSVPPLLLPPPTTTTTAAPPPRVRAAAVGAPTPAVFGSGACGGDLPPCSVMRCESGGNLRAENPTSSASGKWQITDGTWNGYAGVSHASYASEADQDAKARQLWAGGAGASHWAQCL